MLKRLRSQLSKLAIAIRSNISLCSVVGQGAAVRSITGCAAPVVAMAPKESQNKVRKIYEAGSSKDDARQQLKAEGYKKARISQLLKDWPPHGDHGDK